MPEPAPADELLRILLIDDASYIRREISAVFAGTSIRCDVAAAPAYGLELEKQNQYALIVVDNHFDVGEHDAIWFLDNLRKEGHLREVPVILWSVCPAHMVSRYLQYGFADVIQKLQSVDTLLSSMSKLLQVDVRAICKRK